MSGAVSPLGAARSQGRVTTFVLSLGLFVAGLAVVLATVVDMRRAFLLEPGAYRKIGAPSAFLQYTPWHLLVLAIALVSAIAAYRVMRGAEQHFGDPSGLRVARNVLAGLLMAMLVVDLFVYRIVQAERVASAGKAGIAKTFALDALPT